MTMEQSRMTIASDLVPRINMIAFLAHVALYRRYCGSWFGLGWSMFNPLINLLIYYFAFKVIIQVPIENYFVYLAAGLIPWTFLTTSVQGSTGAITSRKEILHSTPLRPSTFIMADISCELFGMMISFLVLITFAVVLTPNPLHWLPLVPVVVVPIIIFTYSVSLIIAYLAVIYRDIPHLLSLFLSFMFWLMPIVYHWKMVPDAIEPFVRYNPFAMFIGAIQVVLHGGISPTPQLLVLIYIAALASAALAFVVVRGFGRNIIYRV